MGSAAFGKNTMLFARTWLLWFVLPFCLSPMDPSQRHTARSSEKAKQAALDQSCDKVLETVCTENQPCFFSFISPKLPSENIYLGRLPGVAEDSPSPARFFGAAFCLGSDLAFALDLTAGFGVLAAAFKSFVASLGGAGDGDYLGKPGIMWVGKITHTHIYIYI